MRSSVSSIFVGNCGDFATSSELRDGGSAERR